MIIDSILNAPQYHGLGKRMEIALKYMQTALFENMKPGRYEILGDDLFVLVHEYQSKCPNDTEWEAHKVYCDIQLVVNGVEQIGYANLHQMALVKEYDSEDDCAYFCGEGSVLRFDAGMFMIFFPEDAHRPGMMLNEPQAVKKIVIKVKI